MFTAVKPNYDRKTKTYTTRVQKVEPGDVIAAVNSGYFIFTTGMEAKIGADLEAGMGPSKWKPEARASVVAYLKDFGTPSLADMMKGG